MRPTIKLFLHAFGAQTRRPARLRRRLGLFSDRLRSSFSRSLCSSWGSLITSTLRRPTGLARWAAPLWENRMVTLWAAFLCEHFCASRSFGSWPPALGSWLAGLRDRSLRRCSVAPLLLESASRFMAAVTAGFVRVCGFLGSDAPPGLSVGVFTCGRGFRRRSAACVCIYWAWRLGAREARLSCLD